MSDTLDATFAKMFYCEHGKELGQFCQECTDASKKDAKKQRKEQDERLAWADFHDNVLND